MSTFRKIAIVILVLLVRPGSLFAQIDKDYFFNNGRQCLIDQKYAESLDYFNVLIKTDRTLHEAFFLRGIAKYNLDDLIGANQDFSEAIKLNPVYTQAYHYRAITLARMGNTESAIADLNAASLLRPEYPGIYFSRGITHFMSKQFEKAIDDYNRFIQKEPKVSDAYVNRGTTYLFMKDTTAALVDYNKAIGLNFANSDAYLKRGHVFSLQKKMKDALADFNKAIELDSTNSMAFFNRGLVYYDMKKYNNTMADFSSSIRLEPNNPVTLYNRAILRAQVGDLNNAVKDYDRVAKITPKNVLVYYNRAAVLVELGMLREALKDYTRAIALYPDFANAYMNRSYIKRRLNDMKSAKADFDIANRKIREYRSRLNDSTFSVYADTSKKFTAMMSFDANFDDNDMLTNNQVDIKLRPLYRIEVTKADTLPQLQNAYFYPAYDRFRNSLRNSLQLTLTNQPQKPTPAVLDSLKSLAGTLAGKSPAVANMVEAIVESSQNQFSKSVSAYGKAIEADPKNGFTYINRSTVQAEMIDFTKSIENSMQPTLLDEKGLTPTMSKQKTEVAVYSYDQAIDDLNKAAKLLPSYAYIDYNLGNIYTLSNRMPEAIQSYSKAIEEYPNLADAYYNRGLIQIYLKDTNKGCLDISKAGELGIRDAYATLKKYCIKEK
ncbi:tetratricopeptide repeat protein [uncultured Acetobacteroides sp.]|uniref:tetratricopeptide repeat protein n=1 Tax=uncultured Acetobacteroides sp. TaxID=1760811 RepID=UPI0029F5A034|nr:tetratricopeptide repeat protein [uncultured Acetobacteroides sp.]